MDANLDVEQLFPKSVDVDCESDSPVQRAPRQVGGPLREPSPRRHSNRAAKAQHCAAIEGALHDSSRGQIAHLSGHDLPCMHRAGAVCDKATGSARSQCCSIILIHINPGNLTSVPIKPNTPVNM